MHGFEVLQNIRKNPSTEHIPIVILSVLSEGEKVRQAMQLGANDYAIKGKIKPVPTFGFMKIFHKLSDHLKTRNIFF